MILQLAAVIAIMAPITATSLEIIAHRGYSALAPENTLPAFKLAWEHGADACENDIHLSADGKIIVMHDKDTKRTTGASLIIAKSQSADLLKLDAGSWKGEKWKGIKVPTLTEALATMPMGKQRFFIEIKCGPEIVPALKSELEAIKNRAAQLAVITFNHAAAVKAKADIPWLKVYLLMGGKDKKTKKPVDLDNVIADCVTNKLDGLDLGMDWPWSKEMVAKIKAAGLGVFVYTVNKPTDAKRYADFGVDGITTDDPVGMQKAITSQQSDP